MALSVSPALALPIALGGLGVGQPIVLLVIGMGFAPRPAAVGDYLGVFRVTFNLAAMLVPSALLLTIRKPTNDLFRMKTGRVERLLTLAAAAIAHHGTLDLCSIRTIAVELPRETLRAGQDNQFEKEVEVARSIQPDFREHVVLVGGPLES